MSLCANLHSLEKVAHNLRALDRCAEWSPGINSTVGVGQREGVGATTRRVLPVSVRGEVSVSLMFSKSEMMDVIGCTSDHGSKRVVTR